MDHVSSRTPTSKPSEGPSLTPARRQQQRAAATDAKDFAPEGKKAAKRTLRVLIVEDNLVNQKVLQKQLRNMGCVTYVANHGGEALEKLRQSWFWHDPPARGAGDDGEKPLELDVVLMDQEMPVMDGLTATRLIREEERAGRFAAHVPVIAVTANARVEQIDTAMQAGMVSRSISLQSRPDPSHCGVLTTSSCRTMSSPSPSASPT